MGQDQIRTYERASSVVFLKADEPFGGLSNMAGGYPLHVQGVRILTSEALYQACRFPHLPELQRLIIGQTSPMTAKMKSKPHRKDSRSDWNRVRVKVMRWSLRVKLAQNWATFSELLLRTGDRPIVEESRKDDFWGAKPIDEQTLVGMNVLGRLLMELREAIKASREESLLRVEPLDIPDFMLFGRPLEAIDGHRVERVAEKGAPGTGVGTSSSASEQASLLDEPAAREAPPPTYVPLEGDRATLVALNPYPAMKNSGVPWLGSVPEHWAVRRLKYLLKERDTRSLDGDEQLLRVSQFTGVTERKRADGGDEPDTRAESLVGYKLVEPNDLVVNIMLAWNGSMGVSTFAGIASPAYCVYRFGAEAQPWYFHYLLRSPAYKARIKAVSTGVVESRLRLYTDDLYRLEALLPPLPEQAAIVRFLNHADLRIRRYIRAKQKLIKLLEEQKQAIIHRVVTRGLDPSVPLKPSGVEWLGDVPEHWEVKRLRFVLQRDRYRAGPFGSALITSQLLPSGEILVLTPEHVARATTQLESNQFLPASRAREMAKFLVQPRDVVFPIVGTLGRAMVIPDQVGRAILNQRLARLRPSEKVINSDYLCLLLSRVSIYQELDRVQSKGSILEHITKERILSRFLPLPPIAEQKTILRAIVDGSWPVDGAIDRATGEISLLREYRSRLIADVITGKLDVREAAARLPDEVEEKEWLEEAEAEGDVEHDAVNDVAEASEEAEA